MRLRTKTGVVECTEVRLYAEERIAFNGSESKLIEEAKDIKYASGMMFYYKTDAANIFHPLLSNSDRTESIFFGNLRNDFIVDTMKSITETGVADMSQLKLQPTMRCLNEEYVFDGGRTAAYCCDGMDIHMPLSSQSRAGSSGQDEGSSEEDDAEEEG